MTEKDDKRLKKRNSKQIQEALSEVNRYFFNKHFGHDAETDNELVMYYIESGGAANFAKRFAEYKEETDEN